MRVLFAGTPDVAVPSLHALHTAGLEIVAVLTRPDAKSGRGRKLAPSPVADAAAELGLPVIKSSRPSEQETLAAIRASGADVGAVVAYGALLRPDVLEALPHGWVNLHFSLLPAWRGAAPVQHALLAGDEMTGASVFRLDEGLDTGPVLGTMTEPVRPDDTSGSLLDRLARAGAPLLVNALVGLVDGSVATVPQPSDGVSHAPKVHPADARIDWAEPDFAVDRRIRACTPEPGAWTTFRDERLKLGPVTRAHGPHADASGDLGAHGPGAETSPGSLAVTKREVRVKTGSGWVTLGEVAPVGRKMMPAPDWARGARIAPGEELT